MKSNFEGDLQSPVGLFSCIKPNVKNTEWN